MLIQVTDNYSLFGKHQSSLQLMRSWLRLRIGNATAKVHLLSIMMKPLAMPKGVVFEKKLFFTMV